MKTVLNEIKSNSYLTFKLGDEMFASHVSNVNNIVEVLKITKVPKTPVYMAGVINLRGKVLPVIDLRIKLGMTQTVFTSNTCILVTEIKLEDELEQIGVLADCVQEVIELTEEQILPPPALVKNESTEFIKGIAHLNNDFVMILNMKEVFYTGDIKNFTEDIQKIKASVEKEITA